MRPLTNLYDNQRNRGKEDPGSPLQNPLPERQAPMQTSTIHSLTQKASFTLNDIHFHGRFYLA